MAIAVEVDGRRVLVIGDQFEGGERWNYVYRNRFAPDDYRHGAALLHALQPELLLAGHDLPIWITPGHLERLSERGDLLADLHHSLLPPERLDAEAEGPAAWLLPYQAEARPNEPLQMELGVRNPLATPAEATVRLVVPEGWHAAPAQLTLSLAARATQQHVIHLTPPALPVSRARIAVDLTLGAQRLGQQAEALVTVRPAAGL